MGLPLLTPPYTAHVDHALRRWMPPGVPHEPLMLFRVLHRNPELAARMFALGAGLLGHGRLPAIDRELVIARVTARSGCSYEWGVHAASLARQAGLSSEDTARLSQAAWDDLREHYEDGQLLELLVLAG